MINGLGIDIISLKRAELNDCNFAQRFMTNNEIMVLNSYTNLEQKKSHMAAVWALKEAIIKATNHKVIFSKIEIQFTNEAPICYLKGFKIFLSLSFEKDNIVAIAISYLINENELK